MKKFTITLALSIMAVLLITIPCNAKGKAKHVVLIGLDGWGAYSVPKADIPTIKQLMADGAYTLENVRHFPLQVPSTGLPCLWVPVPNCTDIHNGGPKHLNFLHGCSINMVFSLQFFSYCVMHNPTQKSVAYTNGMVLNIW